MTSVSNKEDFSSFCKRVKSCMIGAWHESTGGKTIVAMCIATGVFFSIYTLVELFLFGMELYNFISSLV